VYRNKYQLFWKEIDMKLTMQKAMLLAAAALVFQASPVLAQGPQGGSQDGPRKDKMFEMHDTNSDGVISKDEFLTHAEDRFGKMDADSDGSVTKEEGQAAWEKMKERHKERKEYRKKRGDTPSEAE
jgi:hypothetical protein